MRVHTSAARGLIPLLGACVIVSCTGSVPAPIAVIAGTAQSVNTGDFVQLDGSGSSDPQNRAITFSWSFAKRPLGSQVSLIDASSPRASFKADAPGEFVVELTVSNSLLVSTPARVTVTVADCGAHAPTVSATATPSTTKPTGVVQLTATASDADNACGLTQTLSVRWTLDSRPSDSTALPTSNTLATTSFTPDEPGSYEFSVIATDSTGRSSQPATVIVTATTCSEDLPGIGSISISSGGAMVMGTSITLQANNVSDTNCLSTGSPQLQWSLTVPAASRAALDNVFGNTPTFLPDVPGAYLVSVTARNSQGKTSSAVFLTINVAACSPAPPQRPTILGIAATQADPEVGPLLGTSANPIPHVGTTVTLIPDGVVAAYCGAIPTTPLTYSWTVTQRPAGSQAQLDSSVASSPTFTPDKVGHYQFAAVAKDTFGNSTASKTFDFDTSACGTNPLTVTVTRGDGSAVPANFLTSTPEALLASATAVENDPAACPPRFAVIVASATFSFTRLFGPATSTISSPSLGSATATFSAAEVGVYVIEAAASAGGHTGSKLVTQTAFLNPVPPAITAPAFATVGTSVTATTPARANMAYAWTVNGAPVTSAIVAGMSTATATATADLTFLVTESSTAVTSSAASAPALVRAAPVPGTPVVIAPTIATDGMPYTASATARAGMTYQWSVGTGGAITSPGGASGVLSGGGTQTSITFAGSAAQSPLRIMLAEVNQASAAASGFADVTIVARANAPTVSLAAAFVTTGGTINATVAGRAGAPFACTVTGGSFVGASTGTLDGLGAASFTITTGAPGILQLSCTQQDAAGTASPSGTAAATVAPTATPPNISAPQAVTASRSYAAFISARSGMTYQWTLDSGFIESVGGSAGELSTDGRTNSIRFNAGPVGTIHLSVKETNQAGDSSATSSVTIAVVSQSLSPVITAPSNVTATRSYIATVPARAGFTYAWEISNGAPDLAADITNDPFGFNVIHFKPTAAAANGTTAPMILTVTETNAAGDSSASSTFTATVFPNPIGPTIAITNALNAILANNAGVTAGEALLATIATQAGITFEWTATNSSPPGQTGGTTFNFTGTNTDSAGNALTLSLTVVASNALHDTATGTAALQVFPRPVAPAIVITDAINSILTNGANVTAGEALHGTIVAQAGITFAWTGTNTDPLTQAGDTTFNFKGTNTDLGGNAVVATLSVTATNGIGATATSATRTVNVFPLPADPIITLASGSGTTVASGADVTAGSFQATTNSQESTITYQWTITPLANRASVTGDTTTNVHFDALANADNTNATVNVNLAVANAVGKTKNALATLVVHPVPQTPTILIDGPNASASFVTQGANGVGAHVATRTGMQYFWTYTIFVGANSSPGTFTNAGGANGNMGTGVNSVTFDVPANATSIVLTAVERNNAGDSAGTSAPDTRTLTAIGVPTAINFAAAPSTIYLNESSTLSASWTPAPNDTASSATVTGTGFGPTGIANGGALSTGALQQDKTFTIAVKNGAGTSAASSASATVVVRAWESFNNTAPFSPANPDTATISAFTMAVVPSSTSATDYYLSTLGSGFFKRGPPWAAFNAGLGSSTDTAYGIDIAHPVGASGAPAIWATTDCSGLVAQSDGTTWTEIAGPGTPPNGLPSPTCTLGVVLGNDLKVDKSVSLQTTVWASFEGQGVFVTTDNGANWVLDTPDVLTGSPPTPTSVTNVFRLAVGAGPTQAGTVYAGTSDGRLFFRRAGIGWSEATFSAVTPPTATTKFTSIAVNANGVILAGTADGRVFRSGGIVTSALDFDVVVPLGTQPSTDWVWVTFSSSTRVFAGAGTQVYRSDDGGTSFATTTLNLPTMTVNSVVVDTSKTPEELFAVGLGGIYRLLLIPPGP